MPRLTTFLWLLIAAFAIVLPLLPVPAWADAPDRGPVWLPHLESWIIGLLVVLGMAALAGRLGHQAPRRLARRRPPLRLLAFGAGLLTTVAAVAASRAVFAGNPMLVDEMAQLLHGRALAHGLLALPVPPMPEAFLITQTMVTDAGWVSQYPPGQTALLALGLLANAAWLVNPLLAGVSALLLYATTRGLYGRGTAQAAVVLWALSAWVMFTSASYLNHVGAVCFALAAWAAVFAPGRAAPWRSIAAGLAIGAVTVTRPLDGIAAAVPVYLFLLLRRDARRLFLVTLGGIPVAIAWGWFNWRLFGGPLTLGYTALYGDAHALGFHTDPWGEPFTPLTALSNLAVGWRRLHQYLFEWPIPALLPLGVFALGARHRRRRDLVVAAGLLAVPALYFFYWHSGFYVGPRFYFTAAPWLVIGTARAWRWLVAIARRGSRPGFNGPAAAWTGGLLVVVWGAVGVLPLRWGAYDAGLATLKLHPERALAEAGVDDALVLVKESWGSRIIVRLWAAGASPGLVEQVYRVADACALDRLGRAARAERWAPERLAAALEQLRAQAAARGPVPVVPQWPDRFLRVDPAGLTAECRAAMASDLTGFSAYGSLAWRNPIDLRDGIVFARDIPELRDSLLARFSDRPVFVWAPPPDQPEAAPVLTLVRQGPSRT